VGVAVKRAFGDTVGVVIAGEGPDDERLITGTREEHVWILNRGCEGGDPSAVTLQSPS